jgi:hypothetical protein
MGRRGWDNCLATGYRRSGEDDCVGSGISSQSPFKSGSAVTYIRVEVIRYDLCQTVHDRLRRPLRRWIFRIRCVRDEQPLMAAV